MYNLAIIGAGPAGYSCAIRAAQMGKNVALIERDVVGGICINWGCTPSKAMITSAKYARHARLSEKFGVMLEGIHVDFKKVVERRDRVIEESKQEIKQLLDRWGVTLIQGEAQVLDPNMIQIGKKGIKAENIVYATGSEPILPAFADPNDPCIISSNKLVTIKELPKELTILGGGIIAFEIATIFCHLGTKVRIVELSCDCLTCLDTDIGSVILREMEKIGVEIMTNHKVVSLKTGVLTLENQITKETVVIDSPMNLIAFGRKPVLREEELKKLGIEHTNHGITVNDYMQTNIPNIYAVGDSTGKSILAHVAIQQAIIAAEHIDFQFKAKGETLDSRLKTLDKNSEPRKMKYDVIPAVIYTIPEAATVGLVPHNPPEKIRTVRYPFTANLRSHIEDTTEGFVKLWIHKDTNRLVGAQVVHEYAGEIIQAYANMIELQLDLSTTANIIHAHPTFNEIVRNSLEHALDRGGVLLTHMELEDLLPDWMMSAPPRAITEIDGGLYKIKIGRIDQFYSKKTCRFISEKSPITKDDQVFIIDIGTKMGSRLSVTDLDFMVKDIYNDVIKFIRKHSLGTGAKNYIIFKSGPPLARFFRRHEYSITPFEKDAFSTFDRIFEQIRLAHLRKAIKSRARSLLTQNPKSINKARKMSQQTKIDDLWFGWKEV